ncbi:MAG: hypothetical protein KOO69_02230 [Victivallales bacterium]|nr:hypothetical protein [Victivallales bacterium]
MLYKENWEETKERMVAFWEGKFIDRPCISIHVPRNNKITPPEPESHKQKWTDSDFIIENFVAGYKSTAFGGEAIPSGTLLVGYALAYGAQLHFSEQTIFHEQLFKTVEDYSNFDFDYSDDWGWKQIQKVQKRLLEAGKDKFAVMNPVLLQSNDLFAVLRGTQDFLMDLVMNPDEVKKALKTMSDNWLAASLECCNISKAAGVEGTHFWPSLWSPKKGTCIQSDVSCMISPDMFEEFIVPELEAAAATFDHVFYHLDGTDAIKHLERVMEIPNIFGIQWSPGAGTSHEIEDWLPMYKKIQAKGKGLCPPPIPKEKLEFAIRELNPRGLVLSVQGAQSVDEANALLATAEKYTKKYWK